MPRPRLAVPALDPDDALAKNRARARTAFRAACEADRGLSAIFQRWWAETLLAVEGQPPARAAEMFRRSAIMFEVITDRRGWPDRMR